MYRYKEPKPPCQLVRVQEVSYLIYIIIVSIWLLHLVRLLLQQWAMLPVMMDSVICTLQNITLGTTGAIRDLRTVSPANGCGCMWLGKTTVRFIADRFMPTMTHCYPAAHVSLPNPSAPQHNLEVHALFGRGQVDFNPSTNVLCCSIKSQYRTAPSIKRPSFTPYFLLSMHCKSASTCHCKLKFFWKSKNTPNQLYFKFAPFSYV